MMTVEGFCAEHFTYNGISEARQRSVRRTLLEFQEFAGGDITTATDATFRDWLASLSVDHGFKPGTVRKYGNMVRCYFRHAWERGDITADMLLRIRAVKDPRGAAAMGTPRPYTGRELERFRAELDAKIPALAPEQLGPYLAGKRKRPSLLYRHAMHLQIEAIVALAFQHGLRRHEIFSVSIDDIHPDNACVVVRMGKSPLSAEPRYREVPYHSEARTTIGDWLDLRAQLAPPHDKVWLALWPRVQDRLAPVGWDRFGTLLRLIGQWELHRFRHTYATNWLRAGMPIQVLQRLLGHASMTQTLVYTRIVQEDLERSVRENEAAFNRLAGKRRAA